MMFSLRQRIFLSNRLTIKSRRYAGHSKWANIKHIKAAKDHEKSMTFARIGRLIRLAYQDGGSADPNKNFRMAQAVEQAKRANMPAASIQSFLKQCNDTKTSSTVNLIGLKGPGGIAVLVSLMTSNFKLSKQNLLAVLKKTRFTVSDGTWDHIFTNKGIIEVDIQKNSSPDDVLSHALDVGAEDVKTINDNGEEYIEFLCDPKQLHKTKSQLEELGYVIRIAHCEYIPSAQITPSEADMESIQTLYRKLDDLSDISGIYDNVAWNN